MKELRHRLVVVLQKILPRDLFHFFYLRYQKLKFRNTPRADAFTHIYHTNEWASDESKSGTGSTLEATQTVRDGLAALIKELGVTTLIDAGCGDFNWMRHLADGSFHYTGIDIVAPLIAKNNKRYANEHRAFKVHDIVAAPCPTADLILCRDVLFHLSNRDARAALQNLIRSGSKYLLTTTIPGTDKNRDIPSGSFRIINLRLPPFNLPQPIQTIPSGPDRVLALWKISDLG